MLAILSRDCKIGRMSRTLAHPIRAGPAGNRDGLLGVEPENPTGRD